MGYSDQKFYTGDKIAIGIGAVTTATASGSNNLTTQLRVPTFKQKSKVLRFRVEVVTAPTANTSGHLFALLNGTSTIAVATLGTGTNTAAGAGVWANIAGQATTQIDLTKIVTTATLPNGQTVVTTTRNTAADIAADTELTIQVIGTATASAHNLGVYDVYLDKQDNP